MWATADANKFSKYEPLGSNGKPLVLLWLLLSVASSSSVYDCRQCSQNQMCKGRKLVFSKSQLLGNLSRHLVCLQDWSSVKLLKTPQGIQRFGKGNWWKPPTLPESARRLRWWETSGFVEQKKSEADSPYQRGVAGQECWLCEEQGEGLILSFEEHCCVWQPSTNQLS